MELLMAIALLCQTNSGISKASVAAYQLKCQQEYLQCYTKNRNNYITIGPALDEQMSEKKFLYQCVLEKDVKKVFNEKLLAE